MYRLLVLDMDGTLLNNKKQISKVNKIAIRNAINAGVKVAICTGRLLEGIEVYLKELNLLSSDNYSITCSGSLIQNNTQTKIAKYNNLNLKDLDYIDDLCAKLNITYNIYTDSAILSPEDSVYNYFDSVSNMVPLKIINKNDIRKDTILTKFTLINEDISIDKEIGQIFPNINYDRSKLIKNKKFNKYLFSDMSYLPKELFEKYTVLKTTPYTLEVIKKNSNKGEGVRILSQNLGIKRNEIICIGDSGNDKHMIKYAGLGVAMGNAFNEIKEAADYITLSNEEDGVAHVIDKFILEKIA
ncbi:MAG: Cof-type HAD-IIB family hydrolase [Bacillota bacterium]|nr:Cof-type HAD-IIB family hydrolase [Bacillota bacterium]